MGNGTFFCFFASPEARGQINEFKLQDKQYQLNIGEIPEGKSCWLVELATSGGVDCPLLGDL